MEVTNMSTYNNEAFAKVLKNRKEDVFQQRRVFKVTHRYATNVGLLLGDNKFLSVPPSTLQGVSQEDLNLDDIFARGTTITAFAVLTYNGQPCGVRFRTSDPLYPYFDVDDETFNPVKFQLPQMALIDTPTTLTTKMELHNPKLRIIDLSGNNSIKEKFVNLPEYVTK